MKFFDLVIIGGGMAAMAAAKTFRAADSVSNILMISDQGDLPIRKPPLSKQLWLNELAVSDIFYNPAKFNVTFAPNCTIESLDFSRRQLVISSNEKVRYGQLLLATGLKPRRLEGDYKGMIHFNTLADYRKLKSLVVEGPRVVVIGGGLLAVEMASSLAKNGCSVQYVYPAGWPLDRYIPQLLGERLAELLSAAGVDCHPGTRAQQVTSSGKVLLEGGPSLDADIVLPLIGQTPSLDFLDSQGIDYSDGIMVDDQLRVTGLEGVFACGDIIKLEGAKERCPHEDNALSSGAHAGQALAGRSAVFKPSTFLYSEFLGLRLESVGFGLARECNVAAEQWDQRSGQGFAVLSKNNVIRRLTWLNYELDSERREDVVKRMIGKRCPQNSADLVVFFLKVAA